MSVRGFLRRADDRVAKSGQNFFGTGPLAGVNGLAFGFAFVALLLSGALLVAGRPDLLPGLGVPLLASAIGLLIAYVLAMGKAVTRLSAEVRKLRDEAAGRTDE